MSERPIAAAYGRRRPVLRGSRTQLAHAALALTSARRAVRGRLRVEIDPFFSRLVLALRLGEFLERYPDLSLELVTTDAPGDLVAHGFDVGVRFCEATGIGLIARKLWPFDPKRPPTATFAA